MRRVAQTIHPEAAGCLLPSVGPLVINKANYQFQAMTAARHLLANLSTLVILLYGFLVPQTTSRPFLASYSFAAIE